MFIPAQKLEYNSMNISDATKRAKSEWAFR